MRKLEHLHQPRATVNAVHIHHLHQIEKQYRLVWTGIGNPQDEYYSNGEGLLLPEPVSPQPPPLYNSPCIQDEDGDARSMPADYQEEHSAGEFHHFYVFCLMHFLESSTNFDEI